MDTWFTQAPLIESITDKGLFVIGMVKQMKQRYRYNDKLLKLDELFKRVRPTFQKKRSWGLFKYVFKQINRHPSKWFLSEIAIRRGNG